MDPRFRFVPAQQLVTALPWAGLRAHSWARAVRVATPEGEGMRAQAVVAVLVGTAAAACGGGSGNAVATAPALASMREGAELAPPTELVAGVPADVVDASHDADGNLWFVTPRALHLRRVGQSVFQTFGTADGLKDTEILSVSGGAAGHAWVGYMGQGNDDLDPPEMLESGGAGEVTMVGPGINVRNFLLITPPGVRPELPFGRNKVRTCWRAYAVKSGPRVGDAWFGCSHGAAMWTAGVGAQEHHHPDVCEPHPLTGDCRLHTGDVPAVALTPGGDAWLGGTYGVMLLDYTGPQGNVDFHGPTPLQNLRIWEHPIEPNRLGSVDVTSLAVAADETLWVGSFHSGLANPQKDGTVPLYRTNNGLPSNKIIDLATDSQNRLWVASVDDGVFVVDLGTLEWHRATGLPSAYAKRVVVENIDGAEVVTVTVDGAIAIYR